MINQSVKRRPRLLLFFLRILLRLFFKDEYLRGRWFEEYYGGYVWALRSIWQKNILRLARPTSCPTGLGTHVSNFDNLVFHIDDLNNFQSPGIYLQNFRGKITLGRGSYIAPNVGIITANHMIDNLDQHAEARDVVIGEKCWLGMNSVILPGVTLGPQTIVAAGSVVTKSFEEGRTVIAGNPAKVLKRF